MAPNAVFGARSTSTAPQAIVKQSAERGIDEKTLEIRAVEVTSSSIGDAPMLRDLLDQIPPGQEVGRVTGDGAYDTRKYHDAIAARSAHAVIPPRKNAKFWKPDTTGAGRETKLFDPQSTSVVPCGGKSPDTTAEAASIQRCIV